MRFLIGFGLTILGGVLTGVTGITLFAIIMFVGVFLFASIPSDAMFYDYRIANSDEIIIRKRYYFNFIPFTIVSYILTLGKTTLKILRKEEYFRASVKSNEEVAPTRITRKEYLTIRNEQRKIYSTQILSKEFMNESYSLELIGFKRKKIRLIVVSILALIMLLMIAEPGGIYLTLIYEAIFIPIIVLWIPEYKDAKILQQAYDKAVNSTFNTNNA
jgi:hypothetical protein